MELCVFHNYVKGTNMSIKKGLYYSSIFFFGKIIKKNP